MRDEDKTKEELVRDLVELQEQLSESTEQQSETGEVRVKDKPSPMGA
ncbi:MAG: hypothetical protein JRF18_02545, partial [Deltaproteobacteria bacterium]|nr:hypothetical protein [Deltaproteobacteria bacterium]